MSLFRNEAINRVNLHYAVLQLAQSGADVFVFVYLLRAGVSVPLTLCTLSATLVVRLALRPLVLAVARRSGIRTTLVIGTLLEAAMFPILPAVHGPDAALLAVIVVGALAGVFYWTSHHAYFAAVGDVAQRGGQIGTREAIAAVIGVAAPLAGGWALVRLGAVVAFGAAAVVQVLAALPLLGAPEVRVQPEAPGGFRAAWPGVALMLADGWFGAGFTFVWQIALFVTLGQSFTAYGGAMALAGLAGGVLSLGVGRLVDLGHTRRSVALASALGGGLLVLQAFAYGTPWLATLANALGPLVHGSMTPVVMSRLYNLAQASPCPMRFTVASEGGWDLGCGACCLAAAGLVWAGLPLSIAMLLSLAGAVAVGALLWRQDTAATGVPAHQPIA
ncbi:MAG TPA: MFS transporter [Candidatus Eisenbacteria bacterium]|nr:MFS transporter [Candidatus Eisenbacteria bacterium]